MNYKKLMEEAISIALYATREIEAGSREIAHASGQNVTTVMDENISKSLIKYLNETGYPVISEESSKKSVSLNDYTLHWIVDEIDGSTNYSKGFPYWSVSVSFVEYGNVVATAVATMIHGKPITVYHAFLNGGVYKDGELIKVSDRGDLGGAYVAFDNSYNAEETAKVVKRMCILDPMPWLKNFGSAVLTIAEVASGMWDAHYHWAFKPCDIAAALLLIPEAGGVVIDLETGEPANLQTTKAVCGNEQIVDLIIKQTGLVS